MSKYILLSLLIVFGWSCSTNEKEPSGNGYLDSSLSSEARAEDLLSQMTLAEKVGQMTQIERSRIESTTIKDYMLGSVLSGGGSVPGNTPESWADMYDSFQEQALATRLGIPIIYGIDAVHGNNNLQGAVIFPHNIGLGATRNPNLVKQIAEITAVEVAATGMDWTFAPAIPIVRDERWGRTYEAFGETLELAEMMVGPAVEGYQGNSLANARTIAACAKHFIGDGGTHLGEDQGDTRVDEATLRSLHLPAYKKAIDAGVATVMASYSSWNGDKVHGSKYLLTDILKGELGFKGFVISDWAAINQLPGDYDTQIAGSINAGIDMVMVPHDYQDFIPALTRVIQSGRVPMERVDDAVKRILKVKFDLGLFEDPFTDRSMIQEIGSPAHRAIGRQAVRESMVLLRNRDDVLPLNAANTRIHVAGKNADDLGLQMGGWSIYWQGGSGDITTGTSIYEGIQEIAQGEVSFNASGNGANGADVAIAVIGETPYAEGAGDRTNLGLSLEDIQVVRRLKASNVKVVVIIVSGRPLILDPILDDADAIIAAWLPGTEGGGVADVLFGLYNPTGKLPVTWPKNMQQIPMNFGDANYDPLFEYGFGLSY